jgi:hypothetical protein
MGPVETVMQQLSDELDAAGVSGAEHARIIRMFLVEAEGLKYGQD